MCNVCFGILNSLKHYLPPFAPDPRSPVKFLIVCSISHTYIYIYISEVHLLEIMDTIVFKKYYPYYKGQGQVTPKCATLVY